MLIPHSRPVFGHIFEHAVTQIVQSGQLAQGKATTILEQHISQYLSVPHTLAVDSGTSALMLAIRALTNNKALARIGIPAFACASLVFAVKNAGAIPVFIDCTKHLTLDAEQTLMISKTLDVLVLVHPFGMVEPLVQEHFACPVIEDIAQSVGATLHGQQVGTFTEMCIGSHHATKPWGGAYGGFIASHDPDLIDKCKAMTNPDTANLSAAYIGHHQLSSIHAVLAYTRIQQAEQDYIKRASWIKKYDALFEQASATPISGITNSQANHFRYIVRCEQDIANIIPLFHHMGIRVARPIQTPLHQSKVALDAWQHSLSIPVLADMSQAEFAYLQQGIQTCFAS